MQKQMRKSKLITVAVVSVVGTQVAHATNYIWNGSAAPDTSWSNPANWTNNSGVPSAPADTVVFNNIGTAALANTVDTSLTAFQLTYAQDDVTKTYTTTIGNGVTLTLNNTTAAGNLTQPAPTPTSTYLSLLVMPTTAPGAGPTGTNVVIQSATPGSGSLRVTEGYVIVTGRPAAAVTANESYAILNLAGLDSFSYERAPILNTTTGNFSIVGNFLVGSGNTAAGSTNDPSAYWGKVILADNNTFNSNRITIGGASGNNAGNVSSVPVSSMVLGKTNNINRTVPGNLNVGSDANAPAKDSSGAVFFRAGLTNPTATIGDPGLVTYFVVQDAFGNRNGLQIGTARNTTSTAGHYAFGVVDATAASGGSEGTLNGWFVTPRIGEGANAATGGGAAGMLSWNKGTIDTTGFIIGATRNAGDVGQDVGQVNIGGTAVLNVASVALDGLGGVTRMPAAITVGQRGQSTVPVSNVNIGIVNISGGGSVVADRIFLGDNSASQSFVGAAGASVVGIVNIGSGTSGGTLITGKIQAGSDTNTGTQASSNTTRLVNFNGGKLQALAGTAAANTASFMKGLTAAYVHSGGGTIDTNGANVTIDQPLLNPTGNGISSVTFTGGSNYKVAPMLVVKNAPEDTTGVGATAVAQIDSDGHVTNVTITNPGTGYSAVNPPTIQVIANAGSNLANTQIPFGGTAAVLTAVLAANVGGGITKVGAGSLTFTGSNTYSGPTTVKNGTMIISPTGGLASGNVTIDSGATLNVNGSLSGTPNLSVNGTANLAGSTSIVNPLVRSLGNVAIGSGGAVNLLPSTSAQTPSINLIGSLVFADATAKLDLSNNKVFTAGTKAATKASIVSGSIFTSSPGLSVGYLEVSGNVEIRGTYGGDANLDTTVNTVDFNTLASNFNASGMFWQDGDFNADGTVNALDFNYIATNFGSTLPAALPGAALGALVPEPATLGLLAMSGLALARRRRQ